MTGRVRLRKGSVEGRIARVRRRFSTQLLGAKSRIGQPPDETIRVGAPPVLLVLYGDRETPGTQWNLTTRNRRPWRTGGFGSYSEREPRAREDADSCNSDDAARRHVPRRAGVRYDLNAEVHGGCAQPIRHDGVEVDTLKLRSTR